MQRLFLAALCLTSLLAGAQPTAQKPAPTPVLRGAALKKPIPADAAVKTGQLPNGLRYYIRRNAQPQHRAELRLVVRAGSVLETEAQRGLAHFMEHMEFNGTQHFPKNELVSVLQASGIRFGADLNAATSYDQTVYLLPVPTDSARVFRQGFQILEDWAHLATLDSLEIEKERGVVLEERRLGRGASQRLRDQYLPVLLNGARYAQRAPIGTEQVLTTFRHGQLRQFYRDWYRPDLLAVVAVGDFDVAEVERLIRRQFGQIPAPRKPQPRPTCPIPPHQDTKVAIVTDPEQPNTVVQVFYKRPQAEDKTLADLREGIKHRLFNALLGARIREVTQQADPPFASGSSSYGPLLGNLDAFTSVAVAKEGNVERALRGILAENARVQQFGFTASELARAKQQLQASLDRTYAEREKLPSATFAEQYVQHFTKNAAYPSLAFYHAFLTQQQPGITLAEVNALAGQFFHADNRVVLVLAPAKSKAQLPTEAQVLGYLEASSPPLTAYQDQALSTPLLARQPTAAPVVSTKQIKELGLTEWTLQNGARVVLKPTTFQNGQVLFSATGLGGTSRYDLPDYPSARLAATLATLGGAGDYNPAQLRKFLAGKQVRVEPYLSELLQGVSGVTTPTDLPTALEVLYSYFTQPRQDAAVVQGFLATQRAALQNRRATPMPEQVFQDTVALLLGSRHPRRYPVQPADLDRVDLDRALAIYKERFANARDYTFFFVGNLDTTQLKPLVEKYIGGLPTTGPPASFRDLGIRNPTGSVSKTVYQGLDDKARVQLVYSGDLAWSPTATTQLDALAEVLQLQLLEKLREEAGGVYSVSVQAVYAQYPVPRYLLRISFSCAPANVEKLIAQTQELIQDIQRNGPAASDLAKFKIETQRADELKLRSNPAWLAYLEGQYLNHDAPEAILHRAEQLQQVTVASTREAANRYFGPNYARFVLLPQPR